jgi:hypothetical protein
MILKFPNVRFDENPFAVLKLLCADKHMNKFGKANTQNLATSLQMHQEE